MPGLVCVLCSCRSARMDRRVPLCVPVCARPVGVDTGPPPRGAQRPHGVGTASRSVLCEVGDAAVVQLVRDGHSAHRPVSVFRQDQVHFPEPWGVLFAGVGPVE